MTRFPLLRKAIKSIRYGSTDSPSKLFQSMPANVCPKSSTNSHGTQPRIAIIAASADILGGHSVQAHALIENLLKEHYVLRFIPINPKFPRILLWFRKIPYVRTLLNQVMYLPSLIALRHVDVVHVFSASYWSFLLAPVPALLMARILRKRVILHYHSGEAEIHLERWGILVHPWLRLAHEIVVPSKYLQSVFSRHCYHVHVICNVVDTKRFCFRDRTPLRPLILSTRNFESHYRIDVTIKAFELLFREYPNARLVLAGAGSEETKLRALASALPTDAVHFVGRVDPSNMPGLCESSDIFVNASIIDNQPVSILEAFAAGLPVVSTAVGGIATMIRDGETGLFIRPGDFKAMSEALIKLLRDQQLALQMARNARNQVDGYAWSHVRDAWVALYTGREHPVIPD